MRSSSAVKLELLGVQRPQPDEPASSVIAWPSVRCSKSMESTDVTLMLATASSDRSNRDDLLDIQHSLLGVLPVGPDAPTNGGAARRGAHKKRAEAAQGRIAQPERGIGLRSAEVGVNSRLQTECRCGERCPVDDESGLDLLNAIPRVTEILDTTEWVADQKNHGNRLTEGEQRSRNRCGSMR